ncbi:hypothetical protein JB92DRAFT_2895097 [Gautieria morchelliformis]|nr:hypothetical protein JB92DRAFT_2895097 [Gautieria morchelliformis]
MCGEQTYAKPDVYLSDISSNILMLIQEDKTVAMQSSTGVTPQLIAEAISTFQHNNRMRRGAKLDPPKEMVFPGIVMHGTAPIFYLIPVTEELSEAVILGRAPTFKTVEGMMPLDNRVIIVQCYEAFERFIPADGFLE